MDTTETTQKQLSLCPIRIPKSGTKLFKYKGITMFFRSVKGILLVYEAEYSFLICASTKTKEKTIEIIAGNFGKVEDEVKRQRAT